MACSRIAYNGIQNDLGAVALGSCLQRDSTSQEQLIVRSGHLMQVDLVQFPEQPSLFRVDEVTALRPFGQLSQICRQCATASSFQPSGRLHQALHTGCQSRRFGHMTVLAGLAGVWVTVGAFEPLTIGIVDFSLVIDAEVTGCAERALAVQLIETVLRSGNVVYRPHQQVLSRFGPVEGQGKDAGH